MYDFSSKYICLILTCRNPRYTERRKKHSHIYSQITKAGFEVIFLYADPTLDSFYIVKNEYYELTVPTEESYYNLAVKMKLAYTFFNAQDIKGILKVDDVYHIDEGCLDKYYYNADYLGIASINIIEYLKINKIFNKTIINDYAFIGAFYWVSKKAIGYIVSDKNVGYFKEEDVYTGFSLSDKDIKFFKTSWEDMGYVKYLNGLDH